MDTAAAETDEEKADTPVREEVGGGVHTSLATIYHHKSKELST